LNRKTNSRRFWKETWSNTEQNTWWNRIREC